MASLSVEKRDRVSKKENRRLRAEGKIPAVVYGKKFPATPVAIEARAFHRAWKEAGETGMVHVEGLGDPLQVLIHEVAFDPVLGNPLHADLYAIDQQSAVRVEVPLEFTGVAPAEKERGGILIKVLHEVEIEALPKDLPRAIEVDISPLKTFEDQIHVRDVRPPAGVKILTDGAEVVALVQEAVEEDLSAEAVAPDLDTIAVAERGKKEEEGETA